MRLQGPGEAATRRRPTTFSPIFAREAGRASPWHPRIRAFWPPSREAARPRQGGSTRPCRWARRRRAPPARPASSGCPFSPSIPPASSGPRTPGSGGSRGRWRSGGPWPTWTERAGPTRPAPRSPRRSEGPPCCRPFPRPSRQPSPSLRKPPRPRASSRTRRSSPRTTASARRSHSTSCARSARRGRGGATAST